MRSQSRPSRSRSATRRHQEYALAQIGVGEIDYEQLTAAVLATSNDATSFDNVGFSGPSALGVGSSQEGFYGGGVGAITFIARAETFEDASALVERLNAVPGLAKVRASIENYVADGAESFWQVQGEGLVTEVRLTGRLLPIDGITGVDALSIASSSGTAEGPVPLPSPTPEPTVEDEES
jgi:hypothetical protein